VSSAFAPIEAVARIMAAFPRPWWVSGGWAIDLFLGQVTRQHGDLEVGLFRDDQEALRAYLSEWELFRIEYRPEDAEWVPWSAGEWMALPEFQIQARRASAQPTEIDFFLNDRVAEEWQCRRDPAITRPVASISRRSSTGIPFLVPEIQLLFKAKWHRPKDESDFRAACPRFDPTQRAWLAEALGIVHPGDPWLAEL
jgi:hypothetical protein